jgi:hypothetical protein
MSVIEIGITAEATASFGATATPLFPTWAAKDGVANASENTVAAPAAAIATFLKFLFMMSFLCLVSVTNQS